VAMTAGPSYAHPPHRSPSSSGLGHRPFTAATRVRLPLGTPAQLHWGFLPRDAVYVLEAPRQILYENQRKSTRTDARVQRWYYGR
jgi:hypothetical protein